MPQAGFELSIILFALLHGNTLGGNQHIIIFFSLMIPGFSQFWFSLFCLTCVLEPRQSVNLRRNPESMAPQGFSGKQIEEHRTCAIKNFSSQTS